MLLPDLFLTFLRLTATLLTSTMSNIQNFLLKSVRCIRIGKIAYSMIKYVVYFVINLNFVVSLFFRILHFILTVCYTDISC